MGWKDILRPIRDGFRDNIPSRKPNNDHETEERRRRRDQDALRGFTYLESFEEVEEWQPEHVSSLQRANTPLVLRPRIEKDKNKTKLTIIHDYSGNYHDYEAIQGSSLAKEAYSCEYMQFIDTFVYFSHKLVCVPPPSWTNTLHRNGVKSLGTFLVEPQSSNISRILQRRSSEKLNTREYPLASQLISIAKVCGFDGWLLNIEKTFPLTDWRRDDLVGFIQQLSLAFDDGCVLWYDSLTRNNTIRYQNGLTQQNLPFAQASGSILTNYAWNLQQAQESKALALQSGMSSQTVVCGIDVWAQDTANQGRPRKTYPMDEGGGTGTGLGVAKLAEFDLGAGIFAPAWPYEHFSSCSKAVERSMWLGDPLPDSLRCACTPANRHDIQGYQMHPIIRYAQEFPAGSETFFYTNFTRAFQAQGNMGTDSGDEQLVANLGSQSILPCLATPEFAPRQTAKAVIFGQLECGPPRVTVYMQPGSETLPSQSLKLFTLRMTGDLTATITYQKHETPEQLQIWLEMDGTGFRIPLPSRACSRTVVRENLHGYQEASHITGISLRVQGGLPNSMGSGPVCLAEILEICIRPKKSRKQIYAIHNVMLDKRDKRHNCLCWEFGLEEAASKSDDVEYEEGMPCSESTGPFSFFVVEIDGQEIGKAFSMEFLILTEVSDQANIQIVGHGFDGEVLCAYAGTANKMERQSSESWDLI